MRYQEIAPTPALSDIVRYFWIIESDEASPRASAYRLFAESAPGLVFFYHCNYGLVNGLTETYKEFTMNGDLGMVGAYLYPYAIPLLFNETSEKISNGSVEITGFLGSEGKRLKEQIVNAPSNRQRILLITEYLLTRLNKVSGTRPGFHAAIREIVRRNGVVSIDALVRDAGISSRHFDRKFLPAVGITPKVFARLVRFQSTLQLSHKIRARNLTELAMNAGYCDQSHFIRDFKEFSGLCPREYFIMRSQDVADNFVRISA
jgi:AraC-like DNA-binding protein